MQNAVWSHSVCTNHHQGALQTHTPTERKRASRTNVQLRQSEQSLDSSKRKLRRLNISYRPGEQSVKNSTRKICRRDTSYKQGELSHDSTTRTVRRQDSSYRQQELTRQTEHNCANTTQLVSRFRTIIQSGPVFVCTSCDQLFYKHSVKTADSIRLLSLPIICTVLLGKISSDGNEYICHTCAKYIRQNKIPPCSIANNLQFPTAPSHLPTLN